MTEPKLKPCPFCGGEAQIVHYGNALLVECTKCRSAQKISEAENAVQSWNQRCQATDDKDERGLKKCPHCGGRAYREGNNDGVSPTWFLIHCADCGAGVPRTCDTRKESEDLWNHRSEVKEFD